MCGVVQFSDSECAERAFANMNGVELAGRPMKVNNVTERDTTAMEYFDGEDVDIGVGMTPAARAQLMAKLSDGHNAGLSVPQVAGVSSVPAAPTVYPCFMISNMFDPSRWVCSGVCVCVGCQRLYAVRARQAGRMISEKMF